MPLGKGQRKLIWIVGAVFTGFILLLLSLPVWFPWLLRPLASHQGFRYASYERLGYGHFALHRVGYTNQTAHIYASRLEGCVPTIWLWRLRNSTGPAREPIARANQWLFESLPTPAAEQTSPSSAFDQIQTLNAILRELQRWLPTASLSNGTVRIGDTTARIPALTFSQGNLAAQIELLLKGNEVPIAAQLNPARPFELHLNSEALHLNSTLLILTNASGLELQSSNSWWNNQIELRAQFSRIGVLPETAQLNARDFSIPRELAGIPNYREIAGSLIGNWQTGRFSLNLMAHAQPLEGKTNLPPIEATIGIQGDTNTATIQSLDLSSPALTARLSNPVAVDFAGPALRWPVILILNADLSKQPWVPLTGLLTGTTEFRPESGHVPEAHFQFRGSEIGNDSIKARALSLDGVCHWPMVNIETATASFEDGSEASLTGIVDLKTNSISGGTLQFNGPLAQQWLPPGYSYQSLSLRGNLQGPFKQLTHAGHLELTQLTSPYMQPFGLAVDWKGEQGNIESFELGISSTNTSVLAIGGLDIRQQQAVLGLSNLVFTAHQKSLLQLAHPCRISAQRGSGQPSWQLTVTPFEWQGPGGQLACSAAVDWPMQGSVQVSCQNLSSTNFAELLKMEPPQAEIRTLQATAGWTNGPVNLALELSTVGRASTPPEARAQMSEAETKLRTSQKTSHPIWETLLAGPVAAEVKITADRTGLNLSNLVVKTQGADVFTVHGFVPVTFNPADPTNFLKLESQQALQLTAMIQPQAAVWDPLEDLTGVILEQPELDLKLSGSWEEMLGQIDFNAKKIALADQPATMPAIGNLQFQVRLDRQEAQLTKGVLQIQGQPVSLRAKIPLGQNFWLGLKDKKLPDWQQATADLRIQRAKLAAFEPLFPELLAPQGELDAELNLSQGDKLSGTVTIQDARTRPLSDLGPIRDINVKLRCRDRFLELQNASAKVGGATLALSGGVDFSGTNWLRGALPPFQISVHGTDVPLSRQPESIIRSDLLLGIIKTNGAPPLISGVAHLRDSFYLSDLSALVPGKVASPSARPPYFSIIEPTLADWRLGVSVDGARFLRVRSTVFSGEVSANLTLQGTLKDPIALGDLKLDSGIVRFPFANLQVQQGLVNLTSQNPYHPQLLVSAISKQFGYDIRMEVSGTADAPIIQFTSNPPLSSEQIVLLITAGQMPQGAYTLTPQQRAQTVALFLGGDLLSKLGFGDQTQQRLTIRSGEQMTLQGKPTYNLEYKLTDRWAVTGEYDRFGDYNAGLKWRIYSK